MQSVTKGIVSEETNFAPLELFKNIGKTSKSSVPVFSVSFLKPVLQNPGFPRVFRISGQLLWSSVAPMQLGAWRIAALYFASRNEIRVVFRVALGRQNTGVLHGPVWYGSTPVEAVGFELPE